MLAYLENFPFSLESPLYRLRRRGWMATKFTKYYLSSFPRYS